MVIKTVAYLSTQGHLAKGCKHRIADRDLVKGYKAMVVTRYMDNRMVILQRQGAISFAMSAYGEEGCIVASAAAMHPMDWMYPQYRESGILFWRGYTPQKYIHHMFGDAEDRIQGRQMPNHFGSKRLNVVTVSSPLATQIPQAAGCAYAMQVQKEKQAVICYFGEGTTSKGDFHTGLNFAATKKAPVIFFCRNNGYAISTKTSDQFASDGVAPKGEAYGIPSIRVDGNDYFAVHEVVTKARKQCLQGKGPLLIEAMTYRLGAHSTSDDPSAYREDEEVEQWKKKDPIVRLFRYLKKQNLWDEEKEQAFTDRLKAEVDSAIHVAQQTPSPAIETLIEDVYLRPPLALKEQLAEVLEALESPCPK